MEKKPVSRKLLLLAALGHFICWSCGDLMLYHVPNGPLNVLHLFEYEKTADMLLDAPSLQFIVSSVAGVVAMALVLPGYLQLARMLETASIRYARTAQIGAVLTAVAGAVMHFCCTTMLWYFVESGGTQEAHRLMLRFFFAAASVPTLMCNTGVMLVCIPLLTAVAKGKTCLPRWAWWANTLPLTVVAGLALAGMGAMNVGSGTMFLLLACLMKRYDGQQHAGTDRASRGEASRNCEAATGQDE